MWWSIFEWLFTSSLRNFWYNFLERSRGTSGAVSTLFIEDVFWVHSSGANYPYHKSTNICLGFCLEMFCTCVRCWYLCPNNCSKKMHRWYIYCFHIFFLLLSGPWNIRIQVLGTLLYSLQTSAVQEVCKVSFQDHTIIERGLFTKFSQRHSNNYYSLDSWLKKHHTFQHL